MGIISNLLFGDNSNNVSYKDAAYKKRYQDISRDTFDSMYGGMTDYLDNNYEGGANKFKYDYMEGLKNDTNDAIKNYNQTKYNVFGNGLIGSLLNPIAQTAGAVTDLAGMALSGGKYNAWDSSKDPLGVHRDIGSDLGALGETALTVVPMARGASLAKAGKAMKAGTATAKQAARVAASQVPKTMGQKIAGGTLLGAGFGATGSLRDMGFENFDPNQFALSTAIGGGIGGVGAGIGGLWNKYSTSLDKDAISKSMSDYSKKIAPYQEALGKLRAEGITGEGDALQQAYKVWEKSNHPDMVARSKAVALLPANAGQGAIEPAQLFSGEKVSQQALDNLSGQAKLNNPYIKANSFKTPTASYMKDVNDKIAENATKKFQTIQEAMDIVKAGKPEFNISAIPRKKAANFGEGLANLKNNLITTNPNGKLVRYGTKLSNLLKTKKGKVGAGIGGGLLLAQLLRNNNSNSGEMSEEELNELYNYVYGGQ